MERSKLNITILKAYLGFLLFDFFMEPHRHRLSERDAFSASDLFSHGKIKWVDTQRYGLTRYAIGSK